MQLNVKAMVGQIAEDLAPILAEKAEEGALKLVALAIETADNPLEEIVLTISEGWIKEHGRAEAAEMIIQLSRALAGKKDADSIDVLADQLTAAQLTQLVDVYQSVEAETRRQTRRHLDRLGLILAEVVKYVSRAAVQAMHHGGK